MVSAILHTSARSPDAANSPDNSDYQLTGKDSIIHFIVHFNSIHSFYFFKNPSGEEIKNQLSLEENIPADMIVLQINGRVVGDQEMLVNIMGASAVIIRATMARGLIGGKGGFGAMLRALAKQSGTKKTTDFGACRDLSGRRLRHVNDEMILQKWKEAKDKGEDFDVEEETPAGIEMWYLGTPSWADGIKTNYKKKFMKPRRKTKICMDWVRAREERKAPEGAPAHWGCPRGRRCEFAHGDEELRGEAADLKDQEKTNGTTTESNRKRDAYVASMARKEEEDTLSDMVLQGMRAQKKARTGKNSTIIKKNALEMTLPILSMDGLNYADFDNITEESTAHLNDIIEKKAPPESETVSQQVIKPMKSIKPTPSWIRSLSGQLILNNEGEIESQSEFATAAVCCKICQGKWYYEVELLTSGLMQIGWADHLFLTGDDTSEDGVGDDAHSWAYDGLRGKKWNKDDADYGVGMIEKDTITSSISNSNCKSNSGRSSGDKEILSKSAGDSSSSSSSLPAATTEAGVCGSESVSMRTADSWVVGDVLGCLLEISEGDTEQVASISFTLNGISLGIAYSGIDFRSVESNADTNFSNSNISSTSSSGSSSSGSDRKGISMDKSGYFYPSLSLEDGEAVLLNIGQRPFAFLPSNDINVIYPSILPDTSTVANTVGAEVIEEKVTKKKPAVKKGKKSKKDLAAEKEMEIEQAKIVKLEEEAKAVAIAEGEAEASRLAVASSKSLLSSLLPYLPVLRALDSDVSAFVPIEMTGASDSKDSPSIEMLASVVVKGKSSSSSASILEKKIGDSSEDEIAILNKTSRIVDNQLSIEVATVPVLMSPVVPSVPISYAPVLLESEEYSSPSLENLKVLGLQHLKGELERRGLKAGGSLEERASRLFSVRGMKESEISKKLKAK